MNPILASKTTESHALMKQTSIHEEMMAVLQFTERKKPKAIENEALNSAARDLSRRKQRAANEVSMSQQLKSTKSQSTEDNFQLQLRQINANKL